MFSFRLRGRHAQTGQAFMVDNNPNYGSPEEALAAAVQHAQAAQGNGLSVESMEILPSAPTPTPVLPVRTVGGGSAQTASPAGGRPAMVPAQIAGLMNGELPPQSAGTAQVQDFLDAENTRLH